MTPEQKTAYRRAYRAKNREKLKAAARKYYEANREKVIARSAEWKEANFERAKENSKAHYLANRDRIRKTNREYELANREVVTERKAAYYQKHREERRAKNIAWYLANPEAVRAQRHTRRAREKGANGVLSKDISIRLMALQKGKCACCHANLAEVKQHLDHIVPLAIGGTNADDNVQLLCASCNLRKGAKHPVDFMRQMGRLC